MTLEALASGLPVVTSAANGAVEAIGGCSAVRVVEDIDDADALAAAVNDLLDPARAQELRDAARARAMQWGESEALDRWETLLAEVGSARG